MKNQHLGHVIGVPFRSVASSTPKRLLVLEPAGQHHRCSSSSSSSSSSLNGPLTIRHSTVDRVKKLEGKAQSLANGIREHVRLGPKLSETVKRKLSLGAKILQAGGVEKIFKHHFSVREGENLFKASQCYLSTTSGPIAGLLFISTNKIAFCSEKSIKISAPNGDWIRIRYKVVIPLKKILRANESQNMTRPSQKYMQIVTVDNFDFWFMGFLTYNKTLKYLQQAISQSQ